MRTLTYQASETLTDDRWEPITVTARLAEPVVNLHNDLHLDGPLSWGAYNAYLEEHGDDLPPVNPHWAVDFDLPLARWAVETTTQDGDPRLYTQEGKVWGWACSRAIPNVLAYTKVDVRKLPALEQMVQWSDAKKHHIALGPYKAKNNQHPATQVTDLTWHALGNADEVKALLSRVSNLGRLSKHGYGNVLEWIVESGADWDSWRNRVLPGSGPAAAIRAPYHHRSRRVPCLSS